MDAHTQPTLVLEFGAVTAAVSLASDTDRSTYSLGKDKSNDFVHAGELTSRLHARIERQHKDYYLIDCSTNGTYVQTEDEQVTRVHRDKLKLWGEGWISLGEPLHTGQPIFFRQG